VHYTPSFGHDSFIELCSNFRCMRGTLFKYLGGVKCVQVNKAVLHQQEEGDEDAGEPPPGLKKSASLLFNRTVTEVPYTLTPNTAELIPTLGALSPPRRARPGPGPHSRSTPHSNTGARKQKPGTRKRG